MNQRRAQGIDWLAVCRRLPAVRQPQDLLSDRSARKLLGMANQRGFTLLELLVTIAVVGILLAWGLPNMQFVLANNRLATQSNAFMTSLALARSEAMKLGVPVTLCKSADGASCTTSGGYQSGWVVYAENTGAAPGTLETSGVTYAAGATSHVAPIRPASGPIVAVGVPVPAAVTSAPDEIVSITAALGGDNTLTGNNNVVNRITFNSQGMTTSLGTFTLCDKKRSGYKREIAINRTGRAQLTRFEGNGGTC